MNFLLFWQPKNHPLHSGSLLNMYVALAVFSLIGTAMFLVHGSYWAIPFAIGSLLFTYLNDRRDDEPAFFGTLLLLAATGILLSYCTGQVGPELTGY